VLADELGSGQRGAKVGYCEGLSSESAAVSSRSARPGSPLDAERGPLLVRLPDAPFIAPPSCACCGEPATSRASLRARGGRREIPVGYCASCALHVARLGTLKLAATLASTLIGVALALSLPILAPWMPLAAIVAFSLAGVVLPLVAVVLRARRGARDGHAASGPAARLSGPNELVCARAAWARELAARLGSTAEPVRDPRSLPSAELAILLLVSGVIAPVSHAFQHPWVRILNLGDAPIHVSVDRRELGVVEASSSESPLAGLETRVPAGRRAFLSRGPDGAAVASDEVHVRAGERHLYAPLDTHVCFWLERTSYGRESGPPETVPLADGQRFWVVPEDVQGWFVPSPPLQTDARATGGTTTVLRQGPCEPTR